MIMHDNEEIKNFLSSMKNWVCDHYYLDIRYAGKYVDGNSQLLAGSISINPLPPERDLGFNVSGRGFFAGHVQSAFPKAEDLIKVLQSAVNGEIDLGDGVVRLVAHENNTYGIYSEMMDRDRWFSPLHLKISGKVDGYLSHLDLISIDNMLRVSNPPFDGLNDLETWLGLKIPLTSSGGPHLNISVNPPVDVVFSECLLKENILKVTLNAHQFFSVSGIKLALRSTPNNLLLNRMQVAENIKWERSEGNLNVGKLEVELENADSVLILLIIGDYTVRRQWILDSNKARNNRFLAVKHYDSDLKMIKNAILQDKDSDRFERGVSALLFMLGFSPSLQIETDSPDLIVTTPHGRLMIVECTIRVSDFSAKIGKLVNRRVSLSKFLNDSGHPANPVAILVCRLPRDEISTATKDVLLNNVILFCGDDLNRFLLELRNLTNPDQLIDSYEQKMISSSQFEI